MQTAATASTAPLRLAPNKANPARDFGRKFGKQIFAPFAVELRPSREIVSAGGHDLGSDTNCEAPVVDLTGFLVGW